MKNNLTEIVFILDKSGSMHGLESDTIGGFNTMLKDQQAVEGEARITTVLFDDKYELLHDRLDIRAVTPLTEEEYQVGGYTALLDAVGRTIMKLREVQKHTAEEYRAEKVLFFIMTDGMENASHKFAAADIKKLIEHQQQKHGWQFVFLGANLDAAEEAGKIGIDAIMAMNYNANSAGIKLAYTAMSNINTAYRAGKDLKEILNGLETGKADS
jgi:uncharacterized protein YegL